MPNGTKILIVDDERINVEFFEVMLSRLGYEVATALDGDDALEQIKEGHPDLVLLDNILPGKTGWEITRIVKNEDEFSHVADTPIIMFSAMDDVEDKIEGFSLGVEDYITKPFNFSEVLARIQAVLRHRELSSQIVRRERRLSLLRSLNRSLIYFTKHIKEPIGSLMEKAQQIPPDNLEEVKTFMGQVVEDAKEMLATVEGLEEQVQELENQESAIKSEELSLDDLEAKYRKHLTLTVDSSGEGT